MLHFGTGSFHAVGDNTDLRVQSLYGLWDDGTATGYITYACSGATCNRDTALQPQSITHETTLHGYKVRVSSNHAVSYDSRKGWYLDLIPPSGSAQGERVVSLPLLRHGKVIHTTLIPSSNPCSFGGEGWLIEIDAHSGARPQEPVFDLNGDGAFDDKASVLIGGMPTSVPVSGVGSKVGVIKTPTILLDGQHERKLLSGSSGAMQDVRERNSTRSGRISWQEVID